MRMLFQMELQGDFSEEARQKFSEEFMPEDPDMEYLNAAFEAYILHNNEIDDLIESYSRGWKLERLAKVDLTVLRICIAELLYLEEGSVPKSVAVSEAVRIAKLYGGENSGKYVNGVLGKITREVKRPEASEDPASSEDADV